jgi:hypothetical protein
MTAFYLFTILFTVLEVSCLLSNANVCYERRQNITDCIHREGHWTSTNNPNHYKYPDAIKKSILIQRWGECDISPPKWIWKIKSSCTQKLSPVRAYSPETMCKIVNGRKILIVGDSLNNEFFHTFLGLAWPSNVQFLKKDATTLNEATRSEETAGNALQVNITCPKVSQNYAISYVRNDILSINMDIPMIYKIATSPEPRTWVNVLNQRNIDIVILNRGAHYKPSDIVIAELKKTFSYLRKNYPNVQIYWRDTPTGHDGCNQYRSAKPLETRPIKFIYDWSHFEAQNILIYQLIFEEFPEVIYMDVSKSTDLRADSHMGGEDCLHYCIPGPIDNWVQLLMASIQEGDLFNCSRSTY